jgi:hypothetical protein
MSDKETEKADWLTSATTEDPPIVEVNLGSASTSTSDITQLPSLNISHDKASIKSAKSGKAKSIQEIQEEENDKKVLSPVEALAQASALVRSDPRGDPTSDAFDHRFFLTRVRKYAKEMGLEFAEMPIAFRDLVSGIPFYYFSPDQSVSLFLGGDSTLPGSYPFSRFPLFLLTFFL